MSRFNKASGKDSRIREKKQLPLKILHVGNHTIPCVGGIENVMWDEAREQARRGNEVHLLVFNTCTNGKTTLPSEEKLDGVYIHRVSQSGPSFYRIPPVEAVVSHARGMDIINVHGFGPWLDILVWKRHAYPGKLIVTTHGGFFHTPKRKWIKKIYYHLSLPRTLEHVAHVIFNSQSDAEKYSFISEKKSSVIPNPVDIARLSSRSTVKKKPNHFLFVGRLSRNKRVDRLIDTFARVVQERPEVQLHIVGEDWEGLLPELTHQVSEKKMSQSIHFHGRASNQELETFYRQSSFFVSASEYEGFGLTAIEAMAAGCIPILNVIPTFTTFANDGRGFVVDFSNPSSAGDTILHILDSPSNYTRMRKKILSYVKSFSIPHIIDQKLALFSRIHQERNA